VKCTRHSEQQIIEILKQGEAGLATPQLCRQHGRYCTVSVTVVVFTAEPAVPVTVMV
jgi:hypothetical protein